MSSRGASMSSLSPCIWSFPEGGHACTPCPICHSCISASTPTRGVPSQRGPARSLSVTHITVPQLCPLHFTVYRVPQELRITTLRKRSRCHVSGHLQSHPWGNGLTFCCLWIAKWPLGHLTFWYSGGKVIGNCDRIKGAIGIILKRLGDERGDAVSVE